MRIGVDIDDTVTFTNEYLIDKALEYDEKFVHGKGFKDRKAYNFVEMFYWSVIDVDAFFKWVRGSNFYYQVEPKDNASKVINKLHDEGNEIIFITRRKSSFKIKHLTKKWMKNYGFKYDNILYDCSKKGEVCSKLGIDLFIDNDEHNIKDATEHDINCILFGTEFNADSSYFKLDNWIDIYKYIKRG